MHPGKLTGDTKAARVYRYLRGTSGNWMGGSLIANICETDCVSTRVSEVRRQLPPGERIEVKREDAPGIRENGKPGMVARWFYRLVKTTGE